MKYKLLILSLFLFVLSPVLAQKLTPAKWSWTLEPAKPSVGQEAEIVFQVKIEKGWYLYSSDFDKDLGPVVTTVTIKNPVGFELVGGLKAINPHSKFDKEIWNGTYTYFTEKGEFRQKIKITAENWKIEGNYDSQTCSNESGLCVPIKGPFVIASSATASDVLTDEAKKKSLNQ